MYADLFICGYSTLRPQFYFRLLLRDIGRQQFQLGVRDSFIQLPINTKVLPQFLMRLLGADPEKFVSCACLQYSDYVRNFISPKQHLKRH